MKNYNELTKKEIGLIEKFIDLNFKNNDQIVDEKILNKVPLG